MKKIKIREVKGIKVKEIKIINEPPKYHSNFIENVVVIQTKDYKN